MAVVKQLKVKLENKPGALAELCSELAKVAVNITAIHAAEVRPLGQVRLVVSHLDVAKRVCEELHLKYAEEEVIAAHLNDKPGALGRVTRKLAEKGVNIEYAYGSIERGSKRALVILGVSDLATAERVVR